MDKKLIYREIQEILILFFFSIALSHFILSYKYETKNLNICKFEKKLFDLFF